MKKNEEYIVDIVDDTNLGFGIARIDQFVVFVPNVCRKEQVRIAITKVQKQYAYARLLEILLPSDERVSPQCSVASRCGGCSLQHMRYQAGLDLKQRHLKNLMKGRVVHPILGMEDPWYYRNKAQFPIQIKDGKVLMGFYRPHSNDIVPCCQCRIQSKMINDLYLFFQKEFNTENAKGLRHLFIRHSFETGQVQIVLIGRQKNHWSDLVEHCVQAYPQVTSIVFNKNVRKDNVILGASYEVLYGSDVLMEKCMGNTIELHFKSFFQVNPVQMQVLYEQALRAGNLDPSMRVIDLYAGTGTIGMAVSKYVKEVIGVEIVPEAVENAKRNCQINGIENCTYLCMDATEFAAKMARKKTKIDVIFVDPPRKGLSPQGLVDLLTMDPKRIVYVSCNPQTLERDLQRMEEMGYHCIDIQPVDLFCHTTSLECVAKIEKMR